jgi:hypothetical protein
MERMHVGAGLSFVTGRRVSAAVLEYARRLAEHGRFEVVEVPVDRPDGARGRVTLVLGPGIQIVSESVHPMTEHVDDDEWVDTIEQEIAAVRAGSPIDFDAGSSDLEDLFEL